MPEFFEVLLYVRFFTASEVWTELSVIKVSLTSRGLQTDVD